MIRLKKRALSFGALGLAAAMVISACGSDAGSADEEDVFVVGAVLPLTGAFAANGKGVLQGLQAQANILNKNGGILGRKIVIKTVDDGSEAQRAVLATREALKFDNLGLLVPGATSLEAVAAAPVLNGQLAITTCLATDCSDYAKYPSLFSMPYANLNVNTALLALAKERGLTKVGILGTAEPGGETFEASVTELASDAGIEIVGSQSFAVTANDITPQLQQLKSAGAEGVLTWAAGATISPVMQGMQNIGWKAPVLGPYVIVSGSDISKVVPEGIGEQLLAVAPRLTARSESGPDPKYVDFIDAVKETGAIETNITSPGLAADMLNVAAYGYMKAGEFDQKAAIKAIEGMAKDPEAASSVPWVVFPEGPQFAPDAHFPRDVDYSEFWSVVQVSPLVDGTYLGEPFTF